MPKGKFKIEDVPDEVKKVWVLQSIGQPLGQKMYNECLETIKKYPQWFKEGQTHPEKTKKE